jgi:nicotinamidase-related amidase
LAAEKPAPDLTRPPDGAALLLIDLQKAIDHPDWGIRNNPDAETNAARLLAHWRSRGWPVFHIRHNSTEPASHFRPGQKGNDFKPQTAPLPGETIVAKATNSAFIGTGLEKRLRDGGHDALLVAGVITNNSWKPPCGWPAIWVSGPGWRRMAASPSAARTGMA